jgi:hypothetical protein
MREQDTNEDVGRDGRNVPTTFRTEGFCLCFRSFRVFQKGSQNILRGSEANSSFSPPPPPFFLGLTDIAKIMIFGCILGDYNCLSLRLKTDLVRVF